MASTIKAVIASQFDATGIKKAEKAFNGLARSIKGTVGALGVTVGISSITNALQASTKAAAQDAKSQALLATQLRNSAGASNQMIASVEESIRKMQFSAGVADDVLRPAFAQLVRATGDVGTATKLTNLALDVSAGTGRDLTSVSVALSKAYQGNTTALSRLGIKVEKGADVFKVLGAQFDGAAAAAANTDPYQKIEVIFGELQETLGQALLPELQNFADWLSDEKNQEDLSTFASDVGTLAANLVNLGSSINSVLKQAGFIDWFGYLFGGAAESFKVFDLLLKGKFDEALYYFNRIGLEAPKYEDRFKTIVSDAERARTALRGLNKTTPTMVGGSGGTGNAAKKEVDKVSEAAKRLAEQAKKTADAVKKQNDALAEFKTELAGLTIQPLIDAGREIGQFEQNAMDSFTAIRDTIQQGLLDKTIGAKGAANLLAYVNAESAAFEKLARQRDELAAKRSLAESIFRDTKSAIVGLANLNSFLERQTETVTETVTRIVSGVKIATTRTIEELKSNGNIVSGFKAVLSKTKEFAQQLKTLRELGLDRNLYAQIVQSGVEAGSETAAAIIEGGAGTVTELNSLFADLNAVGSEIANQTAEIMYDAGETITSSLIAGLKAQEAALVEQARKMAEVFNQSFASQVSSLQTPTVEATGKETLSFTLADIKKMTGDLGTGAIAQQNAKLAAQLINRPEYTAYGTVVNVTVKADATTNGKALGAAIQAELNKYAKASK